MLCKKVLPLLSEFFDEVLDADTSDSGISASGPVRPVPERIRQPF